LVYYQHGAINDKSTWGTGPEIFNTQNAKVYGNWIGNRYKDRTNIIWILGGDRNPRNEQDEDIWRAMAAGIMTATMVKLSSVIILSLVIQVRLPGFIMMTGSLSICFRTGIAEDNAVYDKIQLGYNLQPTKPVMDAEPIYEDHPVCFNAKDLGTSNAYDVRKFAYLNLFAGAHGHTYGCHDIWQMYSPKSEGINGPHFYWYDALDFTRRQSNAICKKINRIASGAGTRAGSIHYKENNYVPAERIQATRGNDYAFVYTLPVNHLR
jgi:hypothetical protein